MGKSQMHAGSFRRSTARQFINGRRQPAGVSTACGLQAALFLFLALFLSAGVPLSAQITAVAQIEPRPALPPGVDPVKGGQELAQRLRSSAPAENTQFCGELKIRKPTGTNLVVPVSTSVTLGPTNWQVTYETPGGPGVGPERLTIVHEAGKSNVYFYAYGNNFEKTARFTGDQAALPFAESDFWLLDLGLEFYHWPIQRLVKYEMRRSRSTRVLESVNPAPSPASYSRVLSWIDVETDGLLRAEAYDVQNRQIKEFSVGSFRKVEDQWQLQDMEIRNVQTKSRTKLEFDLKAR